MPCPNTQCDSEGNFAKISKTIPINISIELSIVENHNIGSNLSLEEITQYIALFKEFHDVFTWSYEEMPGIDFSIVEHEIKLSKCQTRKTKITSNES